MIISLNSFLNESTQHLLSSRYVLGAVPNTKD